MVRKLLGAAVALTLAALPSLVVAQAPAAPRASSAHGTATRVLGEVVAPPTAPTAVRGQSEPAGDNDKEDVNDEGPKAHEEQNDVEEGNEMPEANEGPDADDASEQAEQAKGQQQEHDQEKDDEHQSTQAKPAAPAASSQARLVGRHKP